LQENLCPPHGNPELLKVINTAQTMNHAPV
jgi:hypothetical protein